MQDQHIQICKQEIERRLKWGPSETWTNQDFELLVEEIFDKTKNNVSLTTLKRIWGKVDYQSKTSVATLNVLAQYLDYAHWRDFQIGHQIGLQKPTRNKPAVPIARRLFLNQKMLVAFVVIIALSSLFFFIDRRQVFYVAEDVVFTSRKVSTGLPNTVVFEYDVSKVIADSFHIQQSWDKRRRVKISPLESKHSSFYYHPGFFHAKLVANSEVIKEHDVFVVSDGWIAMIERLPEPIYVNNLLTKENGYLGLNMSAYPKQADHFQDKDFFVAYYYVKDFGETDAGNLDFECRIRNNTEMGSVCRESRISILCTRGFYSIPLCMPGCVGNIRLTLGNLSLSGKTQDLSALGCDLTNWTDFKLHVENNSCEISINDEVKLTAKHERDLGRVVGIKFKFNGIGEVEMVKLSELDNEIIFEDSFVSNL